MIHIFAEFKQDVILCICTRVYYVMYYRLIWDTKRARELCGHDQYISRVSRRMLDQRQELVSCSDVIPEGS